MTSMTLRGIDEELAHNLKELARHQGISLNALTLRLIREAFSGYGRLTNGARCIDIVY